MENALLKAKDGGVDRKPASPEDRTDPGAVGALRADGEGEGRE